MSSSKAKGIKSAGGRQFNRLLADEVCASAVAMLDTACSVVVWRVLARHCIRQFPLQIPSRTPPCAITFQLQSSNRRVGEPKIGKLRPCIQAEALYRLYGHSRSRGIALLFLDQGTRRVWGGQTHAPVALYHRERPGTHCTVPLPFI